MLKLKGYTLIEVLVVIALVAILATLTLIAINPAKNYQDATDTSIKNDVAELRRLLEFYEIDTQTNNVTYNNGLELPLVNIDSLMQDGVSLDLIDGLVPTFIESEDLAKYSSYAFGKLSTGQIIVGGVLSNSIVYAQGLFGGTYFANGNPVPSGLCQVTYNVTSQWFNGFTADVTISNQDTSDITSWSISWSFSGDQQITNAWNVSWFQSGSSFSGSNLAYNNLIAANGGSVTFGFQASFDVNNYAPVNSAISVNGSPCNVSLVNVIEDPGSQPSSSYCHVDYIIPNQWANGFIANVTITNLDSNNINSWSLVWSFPGDQNIVNYWDSALNQSGANVTAQNLVYNSTIAPNGSVTFGFQAGYSGSNSAITSDQFTLNGTQCE